MSFLPWFDTSNLTINTIPDPVDTNLELFYDFNDSACYPGTGTAITDLSSRGNDATLSGPTFVSGSPSYFDFDNSQSDIITTDLTMGANVTGTSDRTAEIWVYVTTLDHNDSYFFWGFHSQGMYDWRMRNDPSNYNPGGLFKTGGGAVNTNSCHPTGQSLFTSQWQQIIVTCTNNGADHDVYVDNSLVYSCNVSFPSTNDTTMVIGKTGYLPQDSNRYFTGRIGLMRVYAKYFSSSEVTQNWDATKGQFGL